MNHQKTETDRKQQKKRIMDKTQELVALILESEDYIHYQEEQLALKEKQDLYEKMKEFRRKNLLLQLEEDDSYEKMQELYNEYKDTLMDPIVSRYMMTEQSICKLIRKIQNQIVDGIPLDTTYMD